MTADISRGSHWTGNVREGAVIRTIRKSGYPTALKPGRCFRGVKSGPIRKTGPSAGFFRCEPQDGDAGCETRSYLPVNWTRYRWFYCVIAVSTAWLSLVCEPVQSDAGPGEKEDISDASGDRSGTGNMTGASEPGDLEYVETIEVTARRPDDPNLITELPAFITTITIDSDAPRFRTLPELLSGAVGVTVKDFGGLGKLSTISIRGSAANQVVVLLDGVRINTASDAGVDLSTLPLNAIERVEVLRGADSAVFGSGAMGGVINLITRKTVPGPADRRWRLHGAFTYGSFNTSDADAGLWFESEHGSYRVTAKYAHSDGDFEFTNTNGTEFNPDDDFTDVRRNNAIDAATLGFWLRRSLGPDSELTGSVEGFIDDKGIPGMITFPSPSATQKDRRLSGLLRYETGRPGGLGYRAFAEISGKYIGLDFDDPLGEQTGVPIRTRQQTRAGGARIGGDVYYARGSAGLTLHGSGEHLNDDDFGEPDRTTLAVSARNDLNCFNEHLWITTLLRYDTISDAGDHWSPKLGFRWFVTDRLSLRANAGYGFRAPSFNELFMQTGFIVGNPDLMPEEALSCDIGFSYQGYRWRAEAAAFQIDSEDLIQYLLVSGFRYKPFNIGKARSRGIELDGSVELGGGVTLSGSYTWDEAVDRSGEPNVDGKQIPGRPEHDLFGKLDWSGSRIGAWVEWHYLSGNYVTRANTKELDNRSIGNAGISWKINNYLQIGAEVKNLNNSDVVDVRGFPLPPRAFFASVRFVQ